MSERGRGRGRGEQSLPFNPRGRGGGRGDSGGGRGGRGDYAGGRGGGRGDFAGGRGGRGDFGSGRGDGGGRGDFGGRGGGRGHYGGRGGGRGDFRGGRGGAPREVVIHSQDGVPPPAPNKEVERVENNSMQSLKGKTPEDVSPWRPGYGKNGRAVVLWTNYFNLVTKNDLELYRYSIEIAPDSNGRAPVGKKLKRVVQLLLEDHLLPHSLDIATDFKTTLFCRKELDLQPEYLVNYRSELEDDPPPNPKQFRLRLTPTGSLTVAELINHLTSTQAGLMFGSKEEIIQALNIVLGHHPKASTAIATVASNRHFALNAGPQEKMSLGAGLQVIRGFFISARAATARILVNVQVKNLAIYDDGPLGRLMSAYIETNGPSRMNLLKFVKKLSIDVKHISRTNKQGVRVPRIKTIQGFATKDDGRNLPHPPRVKSVFGGPKDVEFFLQTSPAGSTVPGAAASAPSGAGKKGKKPAKAGPAPSTDGRYISVYDFFKQTYNIVCRDPSLPVINVATRDNPSYLPVDVADVLPGQAARAKLSGDQTSQMIRFAVRQPHMNAQSIVSSGSQLLGFDPTNPTLTAFDTNVTPKMITVPGRILPSPDVRYNAYDPAKKATKQTSLSTRFGSWNMISVQFDKPAKLPSWTYLRIWVPGPSPFRSEDDFHAKMDALQNKLKQLGIAVADKYMTGQSIQVNAQNAESQIELALNRFAQNQKRPKLVLVVVPNSLSTPVYNHVKHTCDVKLGLLNVCVLEKKFAGANEQYMANVGLKFNLKLGGSNHSIQPQSLNFIQQGQTMVVGIDVTHPSPGSASTAPSVAGIVASVDASLAQWPAEVRIQTARQEMVAGLDVMFKSRLKIWQDKNRTLPQNILVYRDGVSEGQYNLVLEKELPALQKACSDVYPASETQKGLPRITIIVVGKRHNTRFYPTNKADADRGGNPMNGTVVDRGVTEARNWDFFLQAHTAIQGTARPAHYYVIYDQIFKNIPLPKNFATAADALEDLTHNMCYLFGRATKAVSICPPAYYADLVCERARCYLSSLFDPSSSQASPGASAAGTSVAGTAQNVDTSLVTIHPLVKDSMFYI